MPPFAARAPFSALARGPSCADSTRPKVPVARARQRVPVGRHAAMLVLGHTADWLANAWKCECDLYDVLAFART